MRTKNKNPLDKKGIQTFQGFTMLLILISGSLFAQQGIGTATPVPEAALEVSSPDKGVLLPKIGLVSSTHFLGGIVATTSHNGMLVYNTNTATNVGLTGEGYYVWQGGSTGAWIRLKTNETSSFSQVISAEYAGGVLSADGANNEIDLTGDNSGPPNFMNYYEASNRLTGGHNSDYDVIV